MCFSAILACAYGVVTAPGGARIPKHLQVLFGKRVSESTPFRIIALKGDMRRGKPVDVIYLAGFFMAYCV